MNNTEESVKKGLGWREKALAAASISFVVLLSVSLFIFRERVSALGNYGYLGAFLVSLVANATIILPVPGVIVLFALGASFNPVFIGLAAGAGGGIGELSGYLAGFGGHFIIRNQGIYDRIARWMRRWGMLMILVLAAFPVFPMDVVGLAAGAARFPLWKFLIAVCIGKSILYTIVAFAGSLGWEAIRGLIS